MLNYIGVKCPVCRKKFIPADDIVVCPICGAPHHRECYAKNSECAFVSDHLSGKEWRAPVPDPQPAAASGGAAPDVTLCPSCTSPNPKDMIFCQICGRRLSENPPGFTPAGNPWGIPGFSMHLDPAFMMYGGLSPDEKIEDETVRDIALYIGENSAYYLPHFKNMDEHSRTISFNFSALLFNFIYYFYRKMYFVGTLLLALFVVCAVPTFFQLREQLPQIIYAWNLGPNVPINNAAVAHYQSLSNIASTINFLIGLVISFCANRFYYLKARSDMKKIRLSRTDPPDERAYAKALSEKGGVSRAAVIVVVSVIVAAYFISAAFLSYGYMGVIQ